MAQRSIFWHDWEAWGICGFGNCFRLVPLIRALGHQTATSRQTREPSNPQAHRTALASGPQTPTAPVFSFLFCEAFAGADDICGRLKLKLSCSRPGSLMNEDGPEKIFPSKNPNKGKHPKWAYRVNKHCNRFSWKTIWAPCCWRVKVAPWHP